MEQAHASQENHERRRPPRASFNQTGWRMVV